MTAQEHRLEVYEPYDYTGANPLPLAGVGTLRGGNGAFYYLLEPASPLEVNGEQIRQLLVLPRYTGDPICNIQEGSCTVNIEYVIPGARLEPDTPFSYNDIRHWGVGKITRSNGNGNGKG